MKHSFSVHRVCIHLALIGYALAEKGQLDRSAVAKAIKTLGVDPEKSFPQIV